MFLSRSSHLLWDDFVAFHLNESCSVVIVAVVVVQVCLIHIKVQAGHVSA